MGLFANWALKRAAKRYARRLGPHLQRYYGASETYTRGQIDVSVEKLKLDRRYIALGYASFMEPADYDGLVRELSVPLAYDDARNLIERYTPLDGPFEPAPMSSSIIGHGGAGPHGGC